MKRWTTKLCQVEECKFDGDLHVFHVMDADSNTLGQIFPADVEDQHQLIEDLEAGGCPVDDRWEDGCGNTCTSEGW